MTPQPSCDIFLAHLPLDTHDVFGRESELRRLDAAWRDGQPRIVALVAPDGLGKTALLSQWLRRFLARNAGEAERILGWSFAPSPDTGVSADEFLAYALSACGDPEPLAGAPWRKGRRLAQLLAQRRTLLVLENVHALQYGAGERRGRLADPGLKALLFGLKHANPGLCLLTTTEPLKDFEHHAERHVSQIALPALSPDHGAQVLRAGGVKGQTDAIKQVARDFEGHPLALRLLAGYLTFTHRGDIRQLDLNSPLSKTTRTDKHVRRVVDGFTIWLQRKPELNILYLLSVCDRMLTGDALTAPFHHPRLAALLQTPAIKGLTDYVAECSADDWQAALARLLNLRLLTEYMIIDDTSRDAGSDANSRPASCRAVDCHPLVRDYCAAQIRTRLPGSWRKTRQRLYDHAIGCAGRHLPASLAAMQPLFEALRHGCALDLHAQMFQEIYWPRIRQAEADACATRLGAPGADLVALRHFLTADGATPVENLPDDTRIRVLDMVGQRLRDLGRLREAAEAVRQSMALWNAREDWDNASERADVISRLLLPAGEVEQAVIHARLALHLYDLSADPAGSVRMTIRLIRTVYASGDVQETEDLCNAIHALHTTDLSGADAPPTPCLDAACCDLFLRRGPLQFVQAFMAADDPARDRERPPLERAITRFLAGKVAVFESADMASDERRGRLTQARAWLDQALALFRQDGEMEWSLHGLLLRAQVGLALRDFAAAAADLEELRELTELAGMPLYLTDYHLESARLVHAQHLGAQGKFSSDAAGEEYHQQMHDHVEVAEALIWRTGYHLRDAELTDLLTRLKDAIPERVEAADIAAQQHTVNWLVPPPRKVARPAAGKPAPVPHQVTEKRPPRRPGVPAVKIPATADVPAELVRDAPKPPMTPPIPAAPEPAPVPEPRPPAPRPKPVRRDHDSAWEQQQEQRFRPAEGYDNVYLYPGELYVAERPTIVWTLLGSCIAVVLHNERLGLGAICHAQLPEERFRDNACSVKCEHPCYQDKPDPARFKYAACAIRYLYDQFATRGIAGDEITVKLFGGAAVLESMPDTINVGEENVKVARQVLQAYNLRIVRKDVGGRRGRTLYFYSDTGEVFMKKHRPNEER